MSVVNKMLRDLDNREQAQKSTPAFTLSGMAKGANYVPPKSTKGLWCALLCLACFSVVAASYSVYLISQTSTPDSSQQKPSTHEIQKGDQYAAQQLNDSETDANFEEQTFIDKGQPSPRVVNAPLPMQNGETYASLAVNLTERNGSTKMPAMATKAAAFSERANPERAKPFLVTPSDGAKSQLSSLRAKAFMASERNDQTAVVSLLQEILLIAPQEMRTRKQLAALLFSKNELNEAKDVLSQGILQAPADSSLRLMLSRIFYRLGDLEKAFAVLIEHPYSALANDELVSFRAALAEKTGDFSAAQQDYLLLVQRNPNDAKWWLGLGVSQDKQQLSEKAISSYQQAQSLNQLPKQVDTFVTQRIQLLARKS